MRVDNQDSGHEQQQQQQQKVTHSTSQAVSQPVTYLVRQLFNRDAQIFGMRGVIPACSLVTAAVNQTPIFTQTHAEHHLGQAASG